MNNFKNDGNLNSAGGVTKIDKLNGTKGKDWTDGRRIVSS